MNSLTTQETEECAFSHRRNIFIFGIRIENHTPTKEAMNETEFSFNKDSSQTHFCCYKYSKDA